jgi:hypothetical protein
MPQFWIAIFFILLAVAELYQSVQAISLPLPAYLVLGMLLAVASNYQHKTAFFGQIHRDPLPEIKEIKVPDPALSSAIPPALPARESTTFTVEPSSISKLT